ncbi:MAG: hypothetical protein R3246_17240, partial [Acidimicrobiia bacterium]|nr:hypothetical protein [Acidimicrobiia bacterium]
MGGLEGGSEDTTAAAELRALVDANADLLRAAYGRQIRPDPTAIERNLLASRTRHEIQQRVDTAATELITGTAAVVAEVDPSDPAAVREAVLDAEVGFTDWFERRQPLLVEAHARGVRPTSLP